MDFDKIPKLEDHAVRLFPTAHITSDGEAELRATAALLAMIRAVSEFGKTVVRAAGGPSSKNIACYTEVPVQDLHHAGTASSPPRPDGLIRAKFGENDWKALVEVKVGNAPLKQDQFDLYLKLANEQKFNAVITVSNQAAQANGHPPLIVDKRRCRSVSAIHFSWDRLLSEAQTLTRKEGIADTDQKWMLDEWIRYVASPGSKIIAELDFGPHWHELLKAARANNLGGAQQALQNVVEQWDGFLRKVGLRMQAKLGVAVRPAMARSEQKDPTARLKRLHSTALDIGELAGTLRIPGSVGDVDLNVLLAPKTVRYTVTVPASEEGRQKTRVNWMLRQLHGLPGAPGDLSVVVQWDQRGLQTVCLLKKTREDATHLMRDANGALLPKDANPKRFVLEWITPLPKGKARSSTGVAEGIASNLEAFYRDVVEHLKPYVRPAPRMPEDEGPQQVEAEMSDGAADSVKD